MGRFLLCVFLALCGCLPAWADIRVQDDVGGSVVLEKPARRIISLAPNITEMLFFVGAGEQIVGADEYSNYPDDAKDILRVNNYAAANYELILSLKPDLIIAWQSGNGEEITNRLRQLGLPLFVIEPRSLESIGDIFLRFGRLTGNEEFAEKRQAKFKQHLAELQQTYSQKTPVRVFYQIWNEPLITLNGQHLVSDVIRLCGGKNVFADAIPLVPYVNIEAVLQANPQVIIASGSSEDSPQWLSMWNKWPTIAAVNNDHVFFIPPDLMQRHSMRILEGASQLCEFLDRAR